MERSECALYTIKITNHPIFSKASGNRPISCTAWHNSGMRGLSVTHEDLLGVVDVPEGP